VVSFIARVPHLQRAAAAVVFGGAALFSFGCGGASKVGDPLDEGVGGAGTASRGGSGDSGGEPAEAAGAPAAGGAGGNHSGGAAHATGGVNGPGGSAGSGALTAGGVKPRLLTQAEYRASVSSLFGTITTPLDLPDDVAIGGFVSVGASKRAVNLTAADEYRVASRAVAAEVFGDTTRWQALLGCEPEEDLGDSCVETFVRTFGKRAFRRELSDEEFERWVQVARNAAALAGNAAQALSALTSGLLQSPNFLYRVETNALDPSNERLKYDGPSMAVRLAYFLTGGPPSAELLAAGESGELDTAEGVKDAAKAMLSDEALVRELTSFFYEYTGTALVSVVDKSPELFPDFNADMRRSMQEGTRLFLEKIVLAPKADVRTFFDSDQTFADATLAPIYGLTPPSSGFAQFTFPPEQGRAGILSQAGVLAAHSRPNFTSPTARGLFVLQAFFCTMPDPPPPDVMIDLTIPDPTWTTRQKVEQIRVEPTCAMCHVRFDPIGLALEHFDAIGQYRETENGRPIDATGAFEDGTEFDGALGLGKALHDSGRVTECLLRNFYRSVNGRDDDVHDPLQIEGMMTSLKSRGYVFRDLVADFVVSDAFRSAPRVPTTDKL
jgi:hypothetical protein